jgi:transcriptional regulator with XRE-family HTH domain
MYAVTVYFDDKSIEQMMKKVRIYSRHSVDAVTILGKQIRLARKRYKWTEAELAERSGISLSTIKRIEAGDMTCSIGLVFEAATLAGVNLFGDSGIAYVDLKARIDDRIALLPKTIRSTSQKVDDDF